MGDVYSMSFSACLSLRQEVDVGNVDSRSLLQIDNGDALPRRLPKKTSDAVGYTRKIEE